MKNISSRLNFEERERVVAPRFKNAGVRKLGLQKEGFIPRLKETLYGLLNLGLTH